MTGNGAGGGAEFGGAMFKRVLLYDMLVPSAGGGGSATVMADRNFINDIVSWTGPFAMESNDAEP